MVMDGNGAGAMVSNMKRTERETTRIRIRARRYGVKFLLGLLFYFKVRYTLFADETDELDPIWGLTVLVLYPRQTTVLEDLWGLSESLLL